eukprot:TRINITY_DN57304_c0_g1_i1.p1 TRINITY_DN57304_c0_g1~~TRINITY_DN57304_c0_g1_i1.p1  ORF type:complete len:237 (+),score=41.01 TRINITY_DN57304_c0_g1_i1:35-712(+)
MVTASSAWHPSTQDSAELRCQETSASKHAGVCEYIMGPRPHMPGFFVAMPAPHSGDPNLRTQKLTSGVRLGDHCNGITMLAEIARIMQESALQQFPSAGSCIEVLADHMLRHKISVMSPLEDWEVNAVDPVEGTALHFAASRRRVIAALALLACPEFSRSVPIQRGQDGSTALHLAAAEGIEPLVQALLDRAASADDIFAADRQTMLYVMWFWLAKTSLPWKVET